MSAQDSLSGPNKWDSDVVLDDGTPRADRPIDVEALFERAFDGEEFDDQDVVSPVPSIMDTVRISTAVTQETFTTGPAGDLAKLPVNVISGYRIRNWLGRGATSDVFLASRDQDRTLVALKILRLDTPDASARFQRGAESQQKLHHPGIARVLEIGDSPRSFIAMDYLPGMTLAQRVSQGIPPEAVTVGWMVEIAEAISFAHTLRVLHRDLKPANVRVTEDSHNGNSAVQVLDFGLARELDDESSNTETHELVGTPIYMAPEQTRSDGEIGFATDVYGLGTIFYEMLTGRPPFQAQKVVDTLNQVRHDDPVLPRLINPSVSTAAQIVCLKCLEKDPHHRYATVADLQQDLIRLRSSQPIAARPRPVWRRIAMFTRRHPVRSTALGSMGLLIVALSVAIWLVQAARNLAIEERKAAEAQTKRVSEIVAVTNRLLLLLDPLDLDDPFNWGRRTAIPSKQLLERLAEARRLSNTLDDQPGSQADMRFALGHVYRGLGLYHDAETLLQSAVDIRRRLRDPQGIAETAVELGRVRRELGNYRGAETLLRESLEAQQSSKVDPTVVSTTRFHLAWALADIASAEDGRSWDESLRLFAEVCREREKQFGTDSVPYGVALGGEALAQLGKGGNDANAVLQLNAALTIVSKATDRDMAPLVEAFGDYIKAQDARRAQLWLEARQRYQAAIKSLQRLLNPDHPVIALLIGDYAGMLNSSGDLKEAEQQIRKALAIGRRSPARGHPQMIEGIEKLADVLKQRGPDERAEAAKLYREAEEYAQARYGATNSITLRLREKRLKIMP